MTITRGLISSTLLDFFVHPAMFWLFGMRSAAVVVADEEGQIELEEEGSIHSPRQFADTDVTNTTDRGEI